MHSINKAARDALGLKPGKTGREAVGDSACKGFLAGCLPKSWGLPVQKHLSLSSGHRGVPLLQDRAETWVNEQAPLIPRATSCPCQQGKITDLTLKCVKLV